MFHGGEGAQLEGLSDAASAAAAVTEVVGGGGGLDVVDGLDLAADGEALLLADRRAARPRHGQRRRGVIPIGGRETVMGKELKYCFKINP